MKKVIFILLILSASTFFWPLPSFGVVMEFMNASNTIPIKVNASDALPVTATGTINARLIGATGEIPVSIASGISIGSVTVSAFPVYSNSAGTPTTSILDSDTRVKINISSDTIGLKNSVDSLSEKITYSPWVGFGAASITLIVGTSTAVQIPPIGDVAFIRIWSDNDCNIGASDVMDGINGDYIPANAPGFCFDVSTTTPSIYLRGRTATCTVVITKGVKP